MDDFRTFMSENVTDMMTNWSRSTEIIMTTERSPGHTKQPMVDSATSELVQDIIYCGLVPVLALIGTTGNVLSLIVLGIQKLNTSTNILLFALTFSDTMFLLITGARRVECIISKFDTRLGMNHYMITLPEMKVISIIFGRFTALVTMIISLERCVAVIKPMKVKVWFLTKRVWCCIIIIFTINMALLFPMFFTMKLNWMNHPVTDLPMAYVTLTDFYQTNIVSLNWYLSIFLTILLRFVPLVLVFTASVTIIITLQRSVAFQKEVSQSRQSKTSKVNKLMLTICILFLLCNIPATVHQILVFTYPEYNLRGVEKDLFQLISAFGILVEMINSAWNFILYFALSEKFATVLKSLFCTSCARLSTQSSQSNVSRTTKETLASSSKELESKSGTNTVTS